MFVSALMAASILLTPPERNPEILREVDNTTITMLVCRPVLPDSLWDAWLRLAFSQGLTLKDIEGMRELVDGEPPIEFTQEQCLDMVGEGVAKLKVLFAAEEQR